MSYSVIEWAVKQCYIITSSFMFCTWSESRAARYCHFNITIGLVDIVVIVVVMVVVVLIIVVIVVARN